MAKFLSKDGKFYMREGKLLQKVVYLTWLINETPTIPSGGGLTGTFYFNQISTTTTYTFLRFAQGNMLAGSTHMYDGNQKTWTDEKYRLVTFTEEPNDTTLAWFKANATPLPEIGKVLNKYTWKEIHTISDLNLAEAYDFKIGDTKAINISGTIGNTSVNQTVNAVIIGINHNAEKEGNNRIHFLIGKSGDNLCGMIDSEYAHNNSDESGWCSMNTSDTTSGGWSASYMRKTFLGNNNIPASPASGTFLAALPVDLRAEMKSCTKYSDNTGGTSGLASDVTATTDYLFLLSEFEVFGKILAANTAEQNSQAQYDYFKAGNSKIAGSWRRPATAIVWWFRSVYSNNTSFCGIDNEGHIIASNATSSYGVLPGFCI